MLEITLIILNLILITILGGVCFLVYKIYKSHGKTIMDNMKNFSVLSEQLKEHQNLLSKGKQNPMEQLNELMKFFKK